MKTSVIDEDFERQLVDPEQHWNELHQVDGNSLQAVLSSAGRRLKAIPLSEVIGVAVAGIALGVLFFSRDKFSSGRTRRFRKLIEGSVIPAASKRIHSAYDSLRDTKSFVRVGDEISKLRSRW